MSSDISSIPVEDLIARGLYDPHAPDAAARLEFIRYAIRLGATLDELIESGPVMVVAKRQLRPGIERWTMAEGATRANVDPDDARKFWRALGLAEPDPDAKIFTESDVEALRLLDAGRAIFGPDLTMQITRVVGAAMSRVADAVISVFAVNIGDRTSGGALTDLDVAHANEVGIGLLPGVVQMMDAVLRHHIEAKSRPTLVVGDEWEGIDAIHRAVGFCDLVGYTSFSEQLAQRDLGAALAEFEARAADVVVEHGGIVVKLIGDEVMFVAPEIRSACDVALSLAETFDRHPLLPPVRVGVAAGRVITREGDYYGPVVNLAARVVKLTPTSAVLAPATIGELDGFVCEVAGTHTLKGFEVPVELVRVRRS